MAQKFRAMLTIVSAIQATTIMGGNPSLFKSCTITVSNPRKYVPGINQTKGETAGRKSRPNAIVMMGAAAHAAITTAGNIRAAVTSTALFANCSFSSLAFSADSLGNKSNPTTTGNIVVFSARTWLIE